jgi:hypothetical protein
MSKSRLAWAQPLPNASTRRLPRARVPSSPDVGLGGHSSVSMLIKLHVLLVVCAWERAWRGGDPLLCSHEMGTTANEACLRWECVSPSQPGRGVQASNLQGNLRSPSQRSPEDEQPIEVQAIARRLPGQANLRRGSYRQNASELLQMQGSPHRAVARLGFPAISPTNRGRRSMEASKLQFGSPRL